MNVRARIRLLDPANAVGDPWQDLSKLASGPGSIVDGRYDEAFVIPPSKEEVIVSFLLSSNMSGATFRVRNVIVKGVAGSRCIGLGGVANAAQRGCKIKCVTDVGSGLT